MRKFDAIFDEEDAAYYASRERYDPKFSNDFLDQITSVARQLAESYEGQSKKDRYVATNLSEETPFDW